MRSCCLHSIVAPFCWCTASSSQGLVQARLGCALPCVARQLGSGINADYFKRIFTRSIAVAVSEDVLSVSGKLKRILA